MKKKLLGILTFVVMVLVMTGCNDIKEEKAVIKRHPGGFDSQICYQDLENNEKCFSHEILLYVEYKNSELSIQDALRQGLITLDDVEQTYNNYYKSKYENFPENQELIDEKIIDELISTTEIVVKEISVGSIIKTITDDEIIEYIIRTIATANKTTGIVTTEGANWEFLMYNSNGDLIHKFLVWKTGYLGFESKEYDCDIKLLLETIGLDR